MIGSAAFTQAWYTRWRIAVDSRIVDAARELFDKSGPRCWDCGVVVPTSDGYINLQPRSRNEGGVSGVMLTLRCRACRDKVSEPAIQRPYP